MKNKLNILIVEDSKDDALLEINQIKKGGADVYYERVEKAEEMVHALKEKNWDIILADYSLPNFNGLEALELLKDSGLDIPFIIISGAIGEEVAVEAMKAGARDYIMKNNLKRLLPAVEREVRESQSRARKKLLEEKQKEILAQKKYELKIRSLVSDMHVGVMLTDLDGEIRLVNNKTVELLGLSKKQINGKQAIPPDWKIVFEDRSEFPGFKAFSKQITTSGRPVRNKMIEVYRSKQGDYKWLMFDAVPRFDKEGKLQQVVWTFVDRTERKKAIEALRESEELYRSILQASPDNITIVDSHGVILKVSPSALKMFGYKKISELIGRQYTDLISSEDQEILRARYNLLFSEKKREPMEYRGLRKDGSIFYIEVMSELIRNNEEQPSKIMLVIRDISKRKKAEMELTKFNEVVEQSPLSIVITNTNGTIEYINPFFTKITGYTKKEALGKTPRILKSGITSKEMIKELWETIKAGKIWQGELCNRKKNGEIYWEWALISPLLNNKGEITHYIGVKEDITDRKKAEDEIKLKNEELIKLNNEKDKFFSIIAHDLRSPFSSLLGITQVLADDMSSIPEDKLQEVFVDLSKTSKNIYKLLENLLQWARMQQGLLPFNPEKVNLLDTINDSISIYRDSARNKEIRINCNIPYNILVCIDENMFQTIIRNLISNSIKFTPRGGNIQIDAYSTNRKNVEISISDTGIGMDESMIKNIFQLNAHTGRIGTDGESSSGLGLILCKDFIDKHGGKIWIESKVNKGTTFHFTINCE